MKASELLQDVFTSGPLQIIGYSLAILLVGLSLIIVFYMFKKVIKPKNIHARIGDNEINLGMEPNQEINSDSANNLANGGFKIEINDFLEIVKSATHDAFISAQKRLEMKEKLYNSQYSNAWQTLHTFILQLNAKYNAKTGDRRDQNLVRYALEYDLNNIMKEDFRTLFKENHIWNFSDSQLEVKINAIAEAICVKLKTRFIDYGNNDFDVLNTVFDGMKAQLYNNINQIMVSAKKESSEYHRDLDKEIKNKYEGINERLRRKGIDQKVDLQEEDKITSKRGDSHD